MNRIIASILLTVSLLFTPMAPSANAAVNPPSGYSWGQNMCFWAGVAPTVYRGDPDYYNNTAYFKDTVGAVQRVINRYGYYTAVDGVFGAGTERGVKDFQRTHGLVVDGVVGQKTATAMGIGYTCQ